MDYNHHYDKIAEIYDQFKLAEWDDQMFPWFIENLRTRLEIKEDDIVADLGGATGKVLTYLREKVKPTKEWVTMDPSPKMCEVASKRPGLIVLQARADTAVSVLEKAALANPPTKFMAKHCAHHFQDSIPKLANDLFGYLPSGGKVLLLVTDRKSSLPLWDEAAHRFLISNADPNIYVEGFNNAGFNTTIDKSDYVTKVSKKFWYEFVRNRMYSTFRNFTDEELEEGIKVLEAKFPEGDFLPLTDHEVFVVATKP